MPFISIASLLPSLLLSEWTVEFCYNKKYNTERGFTISTNEDSNFHMKCKDTSEQRNEIQKINMLTLVLGMKQKENKKQC